MKEEGKMTTKLIRLVILSAVVSGLGSATIAKPVAGTAPQESTVKKAGNEVADKAEDAKDQTVKAGNEVGDKAEDVKDETVKGTKKAAKVSKKVGNEAADKAEDVKDETVKVSKKVGNEAADKAEDVKDETVKGAKKTGNWFSRVFKKIF